MVKWTNTNKVSSSQQSSIICIVLGHLSCSKCAVCTQLNFCCLPICFKRQICLTDKTEYAKISVFQAFIAVGDIFYCYINPYEIYM